MTPLTTVIVGPGLVSFQPGCVPTASPFSQIVTSLLEAGEADGGVVLKSSARLTVPITEARIANKRRLAKGQVSKRRRPEFICFIEANCI